jgi:hypothetical protein
MRFRGPLLKTLLTVTYILSSITGASTGLQADEQRRFLEVRRRQLELQSARKQYERSETLGAQGLLSQNDIERDRNMVVAAQLSYQQAVLALLDLQPRISVRSSVKTQTADGRKFVRLVIANLTPTFDDSQFKLLNNFDGADPIPEELRTRTVNDVFVSLRDSGSATSSDPGGQRISNATISLPYEVHIPQMKYGEAKTLDFQLLRDVDSVIVALVYRNQTQELPIQLQHSAGSGAIQISSSQFSQEADFGSQATYNILLERPTVDVRTVQLKAINLPRQISYSFIDLQSQARLSQINFPAGVTRQSLGLRLFLPERDDEQMRVDAPLQFWALALDSAGTTHLQEERTYTDSELSSVPGKVRLEVIPRGVGKIEVSAPSLFSEIQVGQDIASQITLRNIGTRRIDNVKLSSEHPLNWRLEFEPNLIPSVDINRDVVVSLKMHPPLDVGIGDYEVRIKTESFADNRRVQSEDKIYRVSVKAKPNLLGTSALIGALLILIIGIVIYGIKMTKR